MSGLRTDQWTPDSAQYARSLTSTDRRSRGAVTRSQKSSSGPYRAIRNSRSCACQAVLGAMSASLCQPLAEAKYPAGVW